MYILTITYTNKLGANLVGTWHDHHQDLAFNACRDTCKRLGIHAVANGDTVTHYGIGVKLSGSMPGVLVELHKVVPHGDE